MSNDSISIMDLDVEDMKMGLTFDNEDSAILSINKWSEKAFCPLSKSRYQKPKVKPDGERIKGRRCFQCCHGLKYTRKVTEKRPWQRVKFTGCPVKINLNEQEDGKWMVTSPHLTHEGHPVTKSSFYSHQTQRKLESSDKVRTIFVFESLFSNIIIVDKSNIKQINSNIFHFNSKNLWIIRLL